MRIRIQAFKRCTYWVTQKLPQIYTAYHATFPIQLRKITVYICGNFWVSQYIRMRSLTAAGAQLGAKSPQKPSRTLRLAAFGLLASKTRAYWSKVSNRPEVWTPIGWFCPRSQIRGRSLDDVVPGARRVGQSERANGCSHLTSVGRSQKVGGRRRLILPGDLSSYTQPLRTRRSFVLFKIWTFRNMSSFRKKSFNVMKKDLYPYHYNNLNPANKSKQSLTAKKIVLIGLERLSRVAAFPFQTKKYRFFKMNLVKNINISVSKRMIQSFRYL